MIVARNAFFGGALRRPRLPASRWAAPASGAPCACPACLGYLRLASECPSASFLRELCGPLFRTVASPRMRVLPPRKTPGACELCCVRGLASRDASRTRTPLSVASFSTLICSGFVICSRLFALVPSLAKFVSSGRVFVGKIIDLKEKAKDVVPFSPRRATSY